MAPSDRVQSLDFFRGFVVLNLLVRPLVCHFDAQLSACDGNTWFLGWDTLVMPQFYFIIGFSMQLTLRRLAAKQGHRAVVLKQLQRSRTLFCMSIIVLGFSGFDSWSGENGLQQDWTSLLWSKWLGYPNIDLYQTLAIIAVAQIIVLPVITRSIALRFPYLLFLTVLYAVMHWDWWFSLMWERVDGGSFGTINHATIILWGSFLDDFVLFVQSGGFSRTFSSYQEIITEDLPEKRRLTSSAPVESNNGGGEGNSAIGNEYSSSSAAAAPPPTAATAAAPAAPAAADTANTASPTKRKKDFIYAFACLVTVGMVLMGVAIGLTAIPANTSRICFSGKTRAIIPCEDRAWISIPFVKPRWSGDKMSSWTMSQRSSSITYSLFSVGLGFFLFAFCFVASDYYNYNPRILAELSTHSLIMYLYRDYAMNFMFQIIPSDSPLYLLPVLLLLGWYIHTSVLQWFISQKLNIRL